MKKKKTDHDIFLMGLQSQGLNRLTEEYIKTIQMEELRVCGLAERTLIALVRPHKFTTEIFLSTRNGCFFCILYIFFFVFIFIYYYNHKILVLP